MQFLPDPGNNPTLQIRKDSRASNGIQVRFESARMAEVEGESIFQRAFAFALTLHDNGSRPSFNSETTTNSRKAAMPEARWVMECAGRSFVGVLAAKNRG
jgi:hypothetical protein